MNNIFYNQEYFKNIYKLPNIKSEIISDLIYGEKFRILSKNKNWIKIKTSFDNYVGYIKNKRYNSKFTPKYKTFKLITNVYKIKNNKFILLNKKLSFASKVEMIKKNKNYIEFKKNEWVKISDLKKINHEIKDYIKIFKIFLNTKYKWGGKNYKGIDCSGLIQLYFYYNNRYCPRDTRDQLPFFKKQKKLDFNFKKKIIFWKGHVAFCLNKKQLIHAYGPRKKVIIMNVKKTINKIFNDTSLKPIYIK